MKAGLRPTRKPVVRLRMRRRLDDRSTLIAPTRGPFVQPRASFAATLQGYRGFLTFDPPAFGRLFLGARSTLRRDFSRPTFRLVRLPSF